MRINSFLFEDINECVKTKYEASKRIHFNDLGYRCRLKVTFQMPILDIYIWSKDISNAAPCVNLKKVQKDYGRKPN